MKIAQVSPLYESVPPRLYGGTERIVFYLTEELVQRGHEVTLFASGDSATSARLIAPCASGLRLDSHADSTAYHILMLGQLSREAHLYDIIHFHTVFLHYPLLRRLSTPAVTTLHGRLDLPYLHPVHQEFAEVDVVSISDSQRNPLPQLNWQGTIHHGLPKNKYRFYPQPAGDYLAFLGRISPEKRPDRAVEIAKHTGIKLKIAAKIDPADELYFEKTIKPLLDHPLIEFIGEIDEAQKNSFLGEARALLFPIDWPEPFGLVMIESLACGTPVIAFRNGSVPEIIEHGVNGYVADDMNQAVHAAKNIEALDRKSCRQVFEKRFTVEVMADLYLNLYQRIITKAHSNNIYDVIGERQGRKTKQDHGGATGVAAG